MSFGVDASVNHLTWGNTEAVRLTKRATNGNTDFAISVAKRRAPGFKELAPSGGVYTTQDLVWLIPKTLADAAGVTPKPGDVVTASGVNWTILECPLNTLRSTYRCMTRDMVLAHDLRDTLNVKRPRATVTTDGAGSRTYSYDTVYTGIAARFQEVSADATDERGKRLTARRFQVWVETRLYLTVEDQITDQAGNVYELKGWRDADRIDQLQQLECEMRWQN